MLCFFRVHRLGSLSDEMALIKQEVVDFKAQWREEKRVLRDEQDKSKVLLNISMLYWNSGHLPNSHRMSDITFYFKCFSLVENPWNCRSQQITLFQNVATLNDDIGGLRAVEGKEACRSFTVLMNALPFEVGFSAKEKTWTLSSHNYMEMCHVKAKVQSEYRSPKISSVHAINRDDIFTVTRVGAHIEFQRNGRKIDIDPGLVVPENAILFPCVYLSKKGDSVTMLDCK
jgi:hypothetical protein